jgi:hypothetical protein
MSEQHAEYEASVEYGIMLDCDKQGCDPKHGDHGLVTSRHPSREQVDQYKIEGRWYVNNHAATLVYRTRSPWEPVLLNDGGES